jgi:hypothetical protein
MAIHNQVSLPAVIEAGSAHEVAGLLDSGHLWDDVDDPRKTLCE